MREGKKGFTLVELMVAALLAGVALVIALPLILVGRNTGARTEKREAVSLAGEAIYEYVADEVKFAGRLYIGDLNEKRPEGENWKSITVSEKDPDNGEDYARLLYGAARELTAGEPVDAGTPLYDMGYQEKTDLVLEAEAVGRNQMRLTVKLMDGEQALYEKTSVLSLLNLTLNATNQIEGYVGKSMSTAPQEDAEGKTENALILWYQSSRETVKPFEDGVIEGDINDPIEPGPDQAVVSLANPQYVKVGETVQVQYIARAEKNNKILTYDWNLQDNQNGDGSYYVEEPMLWADTSKTLSIKGLNVSPDDKKVKLTLVVTFEDGTTASDSCDVIVYEGYKPGEGPVDHFVIVPDGLEDEYIQHPEYPIWMKKGEQKRIWLEAVDESGNIQLYSPDNWFCPWNGPWKDPWGNDSDYLAFGFVWNWQPALLTMDGNPYLENGRNAERNADGSGKNYAVLEAQDIDLGYNYSRNHQKVYFGRNGATAYGPNGMDAITVSRDVNIYDAEVVWTYRTDSGGSTEHKVEKTDIPLIQVLSTEKTIELMLDLNVITNLENNVSQLNKPEIDPESVVWNYKGDRKDGGDFCTFGINGNTGDSWQLEIGENRISVEFEDTSGFSYREEIIVRVPSEIAYVKFKQDKYVLVNMNQEIDGVSSKEIEYELYDKEGNVLYEGLDDEVVKEAYEASWSYTPGNVSDCPFELKVKSHIATVKAKQEGTGTLELVLKEKGSGREILGEGEEPCICTIDVMSMDIQMKLRYKDNTGSGNVLSTSIESGKTIPVFSSTAGLIAGFDAEIKLPAEVDRDLTDRQRDILNATDWKKAAWKRTGSNLFWGNQEWNNNIYNIGYNGGTGTEKFLVTAALDAAVRGEISVIVNEAPVDTIEIENVKGNGSELVIGAGADRPNDQYNSVTLKATLKGKDGKDCDTSVVWTIRSGKELVDTSKSVWNIEVDSEDTSYFPVIKLRNDLTEADAGKKIVVRATSASSGKHEEYEITLLPQFKIIYPYTEQFRLIHMSDGKVNSSNAAPGRRTLRASRSANWSISPSKSWLGYEGDNSGVEEFKVVTQNITSGTSKFMVEARDILTGQTDSRAVTVEFEKIESGSGDQNGWLLHFKPNGVTEMEVGETKSFEASSGIAIRKTLVKTGDVASVRDEYLPETNWIGASYGGSLRVKALSPGTVTFYSSTLVFGIYSAEYVRVVVYGLKFDSDSYEVNVTKSNLNLADQLKSGGINIDACTWESSNRNIAEVSDRGTVVLLKPGKTTITVSGSGDNGKEYSAQCELTVKSDDGEVNSIINRWKDYGISVVNLLTGSVKYGRAEMESRISGSSNYPVYYLVESKSAGKNAKNILRTEGNYAVATGEGEVSIIAGAGDKLSLPLTARVYELKEITVESTVDGGMLNFITDGKKSLELSAEFDWGSNSESNVPKEFREYEWTIDEKSKEYVDITTNSDGTCTVTAKGMGAAYITCRSLANPDIYETYVVIVSF